MQLFLYEFAKLLDVERPNWRKDTVLQLDGATYHLCKETQDLLAKLRMNVIFSGPQSYDTAPAELFFAMFKNRDLNPGNQKTGKK